VGVRADLHRSCGLALVAEGVHVAHDRVTDLVVGLSEDVDGADIGHLVHGGHQRDVGVGHVGDAVRPHAAGDDHVLGGDRALVGDDGLDPAPPIRAIAAVGHQVEHLGVGKHPAASGLDGLAAHHGAGLQRVDHADGRAVEAPLDHVGVDERHQLLHLGRSEQAGLDAPGRRRGHAPVELVHALGGAGHLDAAGVDREVQVAVLIGRLLPQQRHLLVVVDREDEVRRVAGGAAGVGQRTFVDQDEVAPAEPGEMPDDAVADYACADNDAAGAARKFAHGCSPL